MDNILSTRAYQQIIDRAQEMAIFIDHTSGIDISSFVSEDYHYSPTGTLHRYAEDMGILSWINEVGQFVIPDFLIPELKGCLEACYQYGDLYVPFAVGEYPTDFKGTWNLLLAKRDMIVRKEFVSELKRISDEKGIKSLPNNFLSCCFEFPLTGFEVQDPNNITMSITEPQITTDFFKAVLCGRYGKGGLYPDICKYEQKDKSLKFVFYGCYGTRYVCLATEKNRKILEDHGYIFDEMMNFPLFNDTCPVDANLLSRWQNMLCSDT